MNDRQDGRKNARDRCYCRASLRDTGKDAFLLDISPEGFRLRVPGDRLEFSPGDVVVDFAPDESLAVPAFSLRATLKWEKGEEKSFSCGFSVSGPTPEAYRELTRLFG